MAQRPNLTVLSLMQLYSTRGWVYRQGEGWIFAELTPGELVEFKSYEYGITIPRMRVRLPHGPAWYFIEHVPDDVVNWFAYCTMPQAPPLVQISFQIHQMTGEKPGGYTWYPVEPGSYETWLWADEVTTCRRLGCTITIHCGYSWYEWDVPAEWKSPVQYNKRIFIYAFVNELTQEVYVGQTENLKRRQAEHLRASENTDKMVLIQSLRAQGREPKPIQLEEVAGEKARERERYWTSYYKRQGYKIINQDYLSLSEQK